jgi:FMN phosphatase YigB (HAD superfamily)
MKKKFFIDFDGTLFDTATYRDASFKILQKHGLNLDNIIKAYQEECLNYTFSQVNFVTSLQKMQKFDSDIVLTEVLKLDERIPDFLFSDSADFLKKIDRRKYEVNMISLGDLHFQRAKIMNSGLEHYFDEIYVTTIQKWDYFKERGMVEKQEAFVLIDDRSDTIAKVSAEYPNAIALEIARSRQDTYDPVRTVKVAGNKKIKLLAEAFEYLKG